MTEKQEQALKLVQSFENDNISNCVFKNIKKTKLIETLNALILTGGNQLYQSKNTCGVAAVVHLACKKDIREITNFVLSLYQFGFGRFNKYEVLRSHNLKKWAKNALPVDEFDGVSLVLIGSIRFVENTSLRFKIGTMDGMTWPKEIVKLGKLLLGGLIVSKSLFIGTSIIENFNNALEQDKQIIALYRTSAWKIKGSFFKDPWHYIVVKDLTLRENLVRFTYWDYGKSKQKELRKKQFTKSMVWLFVF